MYLGVNVSFGGVSRLGGFYVIGDHVQRLRDHDQLHPEMRRGGVRSGSRRVRNRFITKTLEISI